MKDGDASGTYNFAGEMDSKPFYKEILWKLLKTIKYDIWRDVTESPSQISNESIVLAI